MTTTIPRAGDIVVFEPPQSHESSPAKFVGLILDTKVTTNWSSAETVCKIMWFRNGELINGQDLTYSKSSRHLTVIGHVEDYSVDDAKMVVIR